MQRKTFHLVAIGLLALGVVVSVIGGVGDGLRTPQKAAAPAAPAAAPPAAPKSDGPAWTFAPRRPIDETPGGAASGAAGAGSAAGTAGAAGTTASGSVPGAPGSPPAGSTAGVPYDTGGRLDAPMGLPGRPLVPGGPTPECPRGTLVRAGSSGPEVFCANP